MTWLMFCSTSALRYTVLGSVSSPGRGSVMLLWSPRGSLIIWFAQDTVCGCLLCSQKRNMSPNIIWHCLLSHATMDPGCTFGFTRSGSGVLVIVWMVISVGLRLCFSACMKMYVYAFLCLCLGLCVYVCMDVCVCVFSEPRSAPQ